MIEISKNGYHSNEVIHSFGNKIIRVENLTPKDVKLDEQKKKICGELYDIFGKYSDERKSQ